MTASVLFLIVAYNNHDEVDEFISRCRALPDAPRFAFSVCDNSETGETPLGVPGMTLVRRPDNPGYLEGALVAFEAFAREQGALPDWIFLTNTDLTIETLDLCKVLDSYEASQRMLLAPRITETGMLIDMNPFLICRRSDWRLALNAILASTVSLAYGYILVSEFGFQRERRRRKRQTLGRQAELMYAPYGAMIGFSRAFLEAEALPRNVPLLAEEFVIAEVARRAGVPIFYEPGIHVHHNAHATTGPMMTRRRAAQLHVAFQYIWRYARRPFPTT